MRGWRTFKVCLAVGLGVLVLSFVCWLTGPQREQWDGSTVYVFFDRQDASLEHLYAVRGQEAVVQVAVFPGYAERKWYHCPNLPEQLFKQVRAWATFEGDVSPPFVPHGPPYARFAFPPATAEQREAWFSDNRRDVQRWAATLRQALVREEYRVDALPSWVEDDQRVKRFFWP